MKRIAFILSTALILAAPRAFAQDKPCADPVPKECAGIKFLGEDKGCACFTCNPDTKQKKVVCTSNAEDKKSLYKMRDEAAKPTPEAKGGK